jgi:site-specific DNA-cytosine methylase
MSQKRHVCKTCGAKLFESKMVLFEPKLSSKKSWICKIHVSKSMDMGTLRTANQKPQFVELFAGSGHVSEVAQERGYETTTIDFNPKLSPDIAIDIHNLRRNQLPENVDVVWASIPCTTYSIQSIKVHWTKISLGNRRYFFVPKTEKAKQSLRILRKTIKLIKQMNPLFYFIENPRGALRHFGEVQIIPYRKTVSYADYDFNYYKPTDIWTNCKYFNPVEIKTCVGQTFESSIKETNGNYLRSLIPPKLINEVFDSIDFLTPKKAEVSQKSAMMAQNI